jgi:tetratricopeptide (TPR) repeat protein
MHSTKLSLFCDKVLEIGWLLAVIITPLFFNVYSSRVFEPDKLTTLRTVALIMSTVWVVKFIEERVNGRREMGLTWRTPLVFPTFLMIIVYFLSTALSVTPWVSLLGSYQRLQGTYTTLAYVVVFLIILQGMRTRDQLDRLITVVILNSLPISLYGLIQRNKLDPLPWGGDVTRRVASNMGNAIFVAAYLIMTTPLTLTRIVKAFQSILTDEETSVVDIPRAATYIFILLVQLIATFYTQSRGPLMGLLASLGVWGFLGLLALQQAARREQPLHRQDLPKDLGSGLAFGFGSLLAAGATGALFYLASNTLLGQDSSLPQGIAAIGAVLVLLGAWLAFIVNRRGWRWLWASALVMAVFAAIGFFAVNPGGPLHEWSRQQPSLQRVTNVLDSSSGTGMVRNLIWEGGVDLYLPHDPIEYPPTQAYPEGHSDPYNALRLLVGYGPESMYVAYNSFYPPLLGHYESRTASPDRSHNETLDSLIITGILGFVVYLWIFGGVFYYALRWLGFLPSDWRRTLFFALLVVGAVAATVAVIPTVGHQFFGLAIPIGTVGGLFLYLVIYAFTVYWDSDAVPEAHDHSILLVGFLSAFVAHFVEINFGIAIASTRTTFWAYAGAFVVAGLGLIQQREAESQRTRDENTENRRQGSRRRKRRRKAAPPSPLAQLALPGWLWPTLAMAVIGGFVLGTLSFDFITNAERVSQPVRIIWRALTILPNRNAPDAARNPCTVRWDPMNGECQSYGALLIFGLTWIMSAVIIIAEMAKRGAFRERRGDGTLAATLYLLISLTVGFGFALVLAGRQAALMNVQAQTIEDVIGIADGVAGFVTVYYGFILLVLAAGGAVLFLGIRRQPQQTAYPWSLIALLVLTVLLSAVVIETNLQPIQADVIYKQADPYDRQQQWLVAIEHYKHAIELVPKEDFYYLYLGRAYLEYAESLNDPAVRETVFRETEQTLTQARELNPLNTDHSANLARMYLTWANFAQDDATRQELLRKSSENYDLATMLSPQNAILWNEWTLLYYRLGDIAGYERLLQHSLSIDPEFEQTWMMCGDVNAQQGKLEEAIVCYEEASELDPRNPQVWAALANTYRQAEQLEQAAASYEEALELRPRNVQFWRLLADTYIAMQQWDDAIGALTQVIEIQPDVDDAWNIHQVLAQLYLQIGQQEQALAHAQTALQLAPEDQQAALQSLTAQIQSMETSQP